MVSVDCYLQRNPTRSRPLVIDACSTELAVTRPVHTLVLDASKGSLCEVVISACVNTIIVKGNRESFVSVVFQPSFATNMGSNGSNLTQQAFTGQFSGQTVIQNKYEIGNIKVGKIHTFSVLGVARGVTFGNIVNQAKYFTLNQTQSVLAYGLTQGGVANNVYDKKISQAVNSDTFIVGSFTNYGHFLVKTTNVGNVSYTCASTCETGENCKLANGDSSKDTQLVDRRTFYLINVLVKCKFVSLGRNKNFRVPLGILYLWAGADMRLCNVSCECIRGPEPCKCFDAVCYDPDATKAPLINCIAVVCGITEILPDVLPCSPYNKGSQSAVWDQCGNSESCDIGGYSGGSSDDCSSEHCDSASSSAVIFGKNFNALNVNPCFIKKANLVIKNSDLVVCELVKRVWTCPLGCQCIDNASSDHCNPRPFVSTCYDQTYVKTIQTGSCGNQETINSSRIYSYLLNFELNTPAFYVGANSGGTADWNMTNIKVQRWVDSSSLNTGDNNWPISNNKAANFQYQFMTSKCRDDPVVDPKTTLPRRCCDLNCEYSIPDRVRPYCHKSFAPTQLSPICRPVVSTSDVMNTVCQPVCAQLCEVIPSQPASGQQASTHVILNKNCCKVDLPVKNVCIAKAAEPTKPSCKPVENKLCDDWEECSMDDSNQTWKCNNNEWEDTTTSCH